MAFLLLKLLAYWLLGTLKAVYQLLAQFSQNQPANVSLWLWYKPGLHLPVVVMLHRIKPCAVALLIHSNTGPDVKSGFNLIKSKARAKEQSSD